MGTHMEEWRAAVEAVWEEIETVRDFIRACQKFDHTGPHDSDQSWAADKVEERFPHLELRGVMVSTEGRMEAE